MFLEAVQPWTKHRGEAVFYDFEWIRIVEISQLG